MLLEQIDQDLKVALKEKNDTVATELRSLKAALKNEEIDNKAALTDDQVTKVISKRVKQHKDSITSFEAGNRADLVSVEKAQMTVLEKYLPKQMDESEVAAVVKSTISSMNATVADFGKVMKEVTGKLKGAADGTLISKLVKENLK